LLLRDVLHHRLPDVRPQHYLDFFFDLKNGNFEYNNLSLDGHAGMSFTIKSQMDSYVHVCSYGMVFEVHMFEPVKMSHGRALIRPGSSN